MTTFFGTLAANGIPATNTSSSKNWTAQHLSTGQYKITYGTGLTSAPAVSVSPSVQIQDGNSAGAY